MSDCESLQNKLRMCPTKDSEVPRDIGNEGSNQIDPTQNGVDVILSSDSGSDEETDTLASQGYISLAQSEDDVSISTEIQQAEQETYTATGVEKPTLNPENHEEHQAVLGASSSSTSSSSLSTSSSSFSSTQNSQMGEDEINLIKSVMMNIQLPNSAIPEWARKIPEEKWKAPLVTQLQQRTNRNNENIENTSNIQSSSEAM